MQQSSKLRNRVALTAQRMNAAADMLTQLEKQKAENDERMAYYRQMTVPLAGANGDIDATIDRLFRLIDDGFGAESIQPLNEISRIVTELLTTDPLEDMVSFEEFKAASKKEIGFHFKADTFFENEEMSHETDAASVNGAAVSTEEAPVA